MELDFEIAIRSEERLSSFRLTYCVAQAAAITLAVIGRKVVPRPSHIMNVN